MGTTPISVNGVNLTVSSGFALAVGGAVRGDDNQITPDELSRIGRAVGGDNDDQAAFEEFRNAQANHVAISIDLNTSDTIAPKEVTFPDRAPSAAVGPDGEPTAPDGRVRPGGGDGDASTTSIVTGGSIQSRNGQNVATVGVAVAGDRYTAGVSAATDGTLRAQGTYTVQSGSRRNDQRATGALTSILGPGN